MQRFRPQRPARARLLPVLMAVALAPMAHTAANPAARPPPAAETTATPPELDTLELRDQFGATGSLSAHRGQVIVAVVVDVKRLSTIERWERDLARQLPGLEFLNVAEMPADAPSDPERVAATLRKRVPATVRVLIDMDRSWARTFGLETDQPNLLVFGRGGELHARFRGRWSAPLAAEVVAAIQPLAPTPPAEAR